MNSRQQRILIVDDNPVNIEVLGNALLEEFDIMAATSGSKALRIIESVNRPDLILLDIMMPDMDGFDLCRQIKSDPNSRSIPIIFVSAKDEAEDEMLGLNLGAVDYLRKPVNPAIALARVRTHLELKNHRNRLEQELKQSEIDRERHWKNFHQLFNHSPQAIVLLDREGRVVDVNPGFEKLFGVVHDDIISVHVDSLIVPPEKTMESQQFFQRLLTGDAQSMETVRSNTEGNAIPVSMIGYPVGTDGDFRGVFVIYEDISERKAFELQLRHQAFHDALTGIPNRSLLNERTERALTRAKRSSHPFALLLLDLDRFKSVNDSLGHGVGDRILKTVAERLGASIRAMDTVARLGGDEFAVLIEDFKLAEEVNIIIHRILESVETPISVNGDTIHITASIGIVIDTRHYDKVEDIFRDADLAMYHAKGNGKATFSFFKKDMHQQAMVCRKLESDLRRALENEELELHFQPIVSVEREELTGFEALVRWKHPMFGILSPDRFIPLAEETGLIIPIGRWVLAEACRQLKEWQENRLISSRISMNINISARQFMQDNLVEDIRHVLTILELNPSCIKLELTESLLMEHSEPATEKIRQLKNLGLQFVIDDFGTGYSSLSYIHRFPIDVLKIDRLFIKNLDMGPENLEIVKTILALSVNLGLSVVAEGVETESQLQTLKELTCANAQGFYFSKPLPRNLIELYLINQKE